MQFGISPPRQDNFDEGVLAFTSELRRVNWPTGFQPTGIDKYDGKTDPESWLTVYTLAIRAAGGDPKVMANYLPVALSNSARCWLSGLPRGPIGSWNELRTHFVANFQGTFERPGDQYDLYQVQQKDGETLKEYVKRFSEARNKIPDIKDDIIIAAFRKGVKDEQFIGKFTRKPPTNVSRLFEMANKYAASADAIVAARKEKAPRLPPKPKKIDERPPKDINRPNIRKRRP